MYPYGDRRSARVVSSVMTTTFTCGRSVDPPLQVYTQPHTATTSDDVLNKEAIVIPFTATRETGASIDTRRPCEPALGWNTENPSIRQESAPAF